MRALSRVIGAMLMCAAAACGSSGQWQPISEDQPAKIGFDLSEFNRDGLYGPRDGLRALSYEFCIPARADLADEVRNVDPTVEVFVNSPGRVACARDQYLCIGNTHQHDFGNVLVKLSRLDYVTRIEPSYGE